MILPRGSSLGLYARKNAIPTLTLNDIHDVLSGFRNDNRISRSIVSCYNFTEKTIYVYFHEKILYTYHIYFRFPPAAYCDSICKLLPGARSLVSILVQ